MLNVQPDKDVLQCLGIKQASSVGSGRLLVDIEEDVLVQLVEKEKCEERKTVNDRRDDGISQSCERRSQIRKSLKRELNGKLTDYDQ